MTTEIRLEDTAQKRKHWQKHYLYFVTKRSHMFIVRTSSVWCVDVILVYFSVHTGCDRGTSCNVHPASELSRSSSTMPLSPTPLAGHQVVTSSSSTAGGRCDAGSSDRVGAARRLSSTGRRPCPAAADSKLATEVWHATLLPGSWTARLCAFWGDLNHICD